MQNNFWSGNRSNLIDKKEKYYGITHVRKRYQHYMYLKMKDVTKEFPYSTKKVQCVETLSERTDFWDTAFPCESENSQKIVQLIPDEDKNYLLTPYTTLMPPLKKISQEGIKTIARNPNLDLQSKCIYSRSDIQHHIRTQQF